VCESGHQVNFFSPVVFFINRTHLVPRLTPSNCWEYKADYTEIFKFEAHHPQNLSVSRNNFLSRFFPLLVLGPLRSHSLSFFKLLNKIIAFRIFSFILVPSLNMQNQSVHIHGIGEIMYVCRICGIMSVNLQTDCQCVRSRNTKRTRTELRTSENTQIKT
jgi:branched-subunit amino acid transport protein AzlD